MENCINAVKKNEANLYKLQQNDVEDNKKQENQELCRVGCNFLKTKQNKTENPEKQNTKTENPNYLFI